MEYHQYYDGLSEQELAHNDSWLIVCIEAAWYCESYHKKNIRFSKLKERSNEVLARITRGERTDFGGSFASILNSDRGKTFFRVKQVSKSKTLIFPKIQLIQKEVKGRQLVNSASGDKQLFRYIGKNDTVHLRRSIVDPPIAISERIDVEVTRANSKEVLK